MSKKKGERLPELLDILEKNIDSDTKLTPFITISKGFLNEILKEGRRFVRQSKGEKTMSKNYNGKLLTTNSPSGNMLYGYKTDKECKDEQKEYKNKKLNEGN
jgi:hypothetical protein